MDVLALFLRTIVVYFIVFLALRMMGKREIGKLSPLDLVISIMIAGIAVVMLADLQKPMLEGIVTLLALALGQLIISYLPLNKEKLRRVFEGRPAVVIKNGKLNRDAMKRRQYKLDDLLLQLRKNKVADVADVEFAILEPSGKLTVIEKDGNGSKPAAKQQAAIRYAGLPLPLIMDGKVQDDSLDKLGKTRFWLKNELQLKGVHDFKEVFFCTIDHRGKWFVDRKK